MICVRYVRARYGIVCLYCIFTYFCEIIARTWSFSILLYIQKVLITLIVVYYLSLLSMIKCRDLIEFFSLLAMKFLFFIANTKLFNCVVCVILFRLLKINLFDSVSFYLNNYISRMYWTVGTIKVFHIRIWKYFCL